MCVQVGKAASPPSLPALRELGADRAAVLPPDHRKHSHGEAAVRHVQELKAQTKTASLPETHAVVKRITGTKLD